jgi:hypothetical protein
MKKSRDAYRILVEKLVGKRPLERTRHIWEDNIRWILREVGSTDWIDLAQDRHRRRALVNAVMNLRVPHNAGNVLSS